MICIKHTAFVVCFICGIFTVIASDLKQIHRRIEEERQVEKIKNKIMTKLENSGVWINRNDRLENDDLNDFISENIHTNTQSEPEKDQQAVTVNNDININKHVEQVKSKTPVISIGERLGDKRDGCLQFSMNLIPTHNNVVSAIIPKRITLWVHIKKKRGRPRQLHAKAQGSDKRERRMDTKTIQPKRDRRRQKGRKIKLFISNGKKRLSKMRMRIYGSGWHSIDLPISQFPELIHSTDKFKICIHCKRCNKKVKVVLYRRQKVHKNNRKPLIPLIHFETADYLAPQTTYRHKRSHQNSHHCKRSCCKLETFSVDITETFPTIIAPKEILFTYCINTCENDVSLHNNTITFIETEKSQHNKLNYSHRQCLPHTYNSFSFLYLLPNSDVMYGTMPNMFPSSCRCSRLASDE